MGEWKKVKLSEVLKEKTERNKNNETDLVLSVTNSQGFVRQSDFFEGTVHSEDISNYKLVRKNEFAYNPSRINVGSIDILKEYDIGALSPMYVIFSVDETKLLPDYFKYYFQTHKFNENVKNNTQGSVRNSLSFKALSEFEYLLPPLEEQKRIVKILDQVNKIIEKYQNLINEKEQFIKSQFVEMFGSIIKNEKKWRVENFGRIVQIERGASPRPIDAYITNDSNAVNWIKIGDAEAGKIYINNANEKITENGADKSRKVYIGDFILSNSMSFGKPYILNINGCVHDGWLVIRDNKKIFNKIFLYYLLISEDMKRMFYSKAAGGVVTNLNSDIVKSVNVIIPDIKIQNEFSEIAELIDKQKFELEKQKQNYIDLKKGLMQQLLTGKVKLDV